MNFHAPVLPHPDQKLMALVKRYRDLEDVQQDACRRIEELDGILDALPKPEGLKIRREDAITFGPDIFVEATRHSAHYAPYMIEKLRNMHRWGGGFEARRAEIEAAHFEHKQAIEDCTSVQPHRLRDARADLAIAVRQMNSLRQRIALTPAHTIEGISAKARIVLIDYGSSDEIGENLVGQLASDEASGEHIALSIVQDMIGIFDISPGPTRGEIIASIEQADERTRAFHFNLALANQPLDALSDETLAKMAERIQAEVSMRSAAPMDAAA